MAIRATIFRRGPKDNEQSQVKITMTARGGSAIAQTIDATATALGVPLNRITGYSYQLFGTSHVWDARKGAFDESKNQWTKASRTEPFSLEYASDAIADNIEELAGGEEKADVAGYNKSEPAWFDAESLTISLFTEPGAPTIESEVIEDKPDRKWVILPDLFEYEKAPLPPVEPVAPPPPVAQPPVPPSIDTEKEKRARRNAARRAARARAKAEAEAKREKRNAARRAARARAKAEAEAKRERRNAARRKARKLLKAKRKAVPVKRKATKRKAAPVKRKVAKRKAVPVKRKVTRRKVTKPVKRKAKRNRKR
jgi:hypothetical protein